LPPGETGNLPGTARIARPLALPARWPGAPDPARPGGIRASSNKVVTQDEFALKTSFNL